MALALGWVATLHVQNPLSWDGQGENQPIQNKIHRGAQGTVHSFITKKWRKKHGSPLRGFWTCGMATKPRVSVIGSSLWIRAVPWKCLSLNFLSSWGHSLTLRTKLMCSRKENFSVYAQVKIWSDWSGKKVVFVTFSSGSGGQPSFPLSSS